MKRLWLAIIAAVCLLIAAPVAAYAEETDDTVTLSESLYIEGVYIPAIEGDTIRAGAVIRGDGEAAMYQCTVIDYGYEEYGTAFFPEVKTSYSKNDNWMVYQLSHKGTFGFLWRAFDGSGNIISEAGAAVKFNGVPTTIEGVYIPECTDRKTLHAGAVMHGDYEGYKYECVVIDYDHAKYGTPFFPAKKITESVVDNWMVYQPTHNGVYGFLWRVYDGNGNIVSEAGATRVFEGNEVSVTGIYIPDTEPNTIDLGIVYEAIDPENVYITWYEYLPDEGRFTGKLKEGTYAEIGNWCEWTKQEGRYWILCRVTAANNPDSTGSFGYEYKDGNYVVTKYNYSFPTPATKKGLQFNSGMLEDTLNLGSKNNLLNIAINELVRSPGNGVAYDYKGKTYYFSRAYINNLRNITETTASTGAITTIVLLLQYDESCLDLIIPSGRAAGHEYYAWNTVEQSGREHLEAILSFLADNLCDESHKVVNWILSNEIQQQNDYYYSGATSLDEFCTYYADAFHMLNNCVRGIYRNARCYMSFDYVWNYQRSYAFTGQQVLECLIPKVNDIPWHIAIHPYAIPLTTAKFWTAPSWATGDDIHAQFITMTNLNALTDWVKFNYGSNHRFLLSEVGFTSWENGTVDEGLQAAAISYAYYITEANDMVDGINYHRHVDNRIEMEQGLYFGLWWNFTDQTEYPSGKKQAYEVYQMMDRSNGFAYTNFALNYIGASSWSELLPYLDCSRFNQGLSLAEEEEDLKDYGIYTSPVTVTDEQIKESVEGIRSIKPELWHS